MFSGHYTSYVKCEDIQLDEPGTGGGGASPVPPVRPHIDAKTSIGRSGVNLVDFISQQDAQDGRVVNSSSSIPNLRHLGTRWVKFDDEYTSDLSALGNQLQPTVVSGQCRSFVSVCLSVCLSVSLSLCVCLPDLCWHTHPLRLPVCNALCVCRCVDSAYLLFYHRKNISPRNLLQYL